VPVAFTKNAPLKADDLNNDFQNLDSRVMTVEAAIAASHAATADNATHAATAAVATSVAAGSVRMENMNCAYNTTSAATDCTCKANEIAIGGGGYSGALASSLCESRNLGAVNPGSQNIWRVSCVQNGGRVQCALPFAICLAVQ
jgi:hypothetical protein